MKSINPQELNDILGGRSEGVILIDVRSVDQYNNQSIKGAINIPMSELEDNIDMLRGYDTVYIQCNTGNISSQAYAELENFGLTTVVNLDGGIQRWVELGFSTIKKSNVLPMVRQVFLTAGLLVLLGVVGGVCIHTHFFFLAGFVGCGLIFSGLTGKCGMTKVLDLMPWNSKT